jgi:hypothetical protein
MVLDLQRQLADTQKQLAEATKQTANAQKQIADALKEIEELRKKLPGPPGSGSSASGTTKLDQSYSMTAEERRQRDKARKKALADARKAAGKNKPTRRGRFSNQEKLAAALRTERVYPDGVPPEQCVLSHVRPVWRLVDGRAAIVAYEVWRYGKSYGQIPDVLGRSEYGIEFVAAMAYQVYVVGLSLDKVVLLTNFFQQLKLRKSQVDALLNQLTRHWESQFETLCGLIANSAIVHADETSWSIKSVWAFLSEKARLLVYGINKNSDTLKEILDPATFKNLVVSDDAAVYGKFTRSQKCWAHLLRKAIKIALMAPEVAAFQTFRDSLIDIYRSAVKIRRDGRLSDEGRARKVAELDDRITELCVADWALESPKLEGAFEEYRLLINELMRLMIDGELFPFVTTANTEQPNGQPLPAPGTNNESERSLRGAAMARVTGRTNKTINGARRQTVITSVLESLKCYLPTYTLSSVIAEISSWLHLGESCFERELRRVTTQPTKGANSKLDKLLPQPSSG